MSDIRVPIGELRRLADELRRLSSSLADVEAGALRAATILDEKALSKAGLESQLGGAGRQAHTLADDARVLAGILSSVVDTIDDADRKGAAALPILPKPEFPLPLVAPPRRPWPFSQVPASVMVRPRRLGKNGLMKGGSVTPPPEFH